MIFHLLINLIRDTFLSFLALVKLIMIIISIIFLALDLEENQHYSKFQVIIITLVIICDWSRLIIMHYFKYFIIIIYVLITVVHLLERAILEVINQ